MIECAASPVSFRIVLGRCFMPRLISFAILNLTVLNGQVVRPFFWRIRVGHGGYGADGGRSWGLLGYMQRRVHAYRELADCDVFQIIKQAEAVRRRDNLVWSVYGQRGTSALSALFAATKFNPRTGGPPRQLAPSANVAKRGGYLASLGRPRKEVHQSSQK